MIKKNPARRKRKKFLALRLSDESLTLLKKLKALTSKSKTRIVEEAIYLHAKELKELTGAALRAA